MSRKHSGPHVARRQQQLRAPLMKNNHSGIECIDRSIERMNEWLDELSLLLGTDDAVDSFAVLRSVLHALRDRLPLIAGSRLDLLDALERLEARRPDLVAPIVLRDVCQLDYAEIATHLGIPVGTVKSRIHQARTDLREYLLAPM